MRRFAGTVAYTRSMFGYEPPKTEQSGSWSEIFAMIRVVFMELAKPLAAIFVTLSLVLAVLILFFTNPPLALIPLAVLVIAGWWLIRRDQQAVRDAQDDLPPHRR